MSSILSQYKIMRKLGRGGFGQVYLATDSKGNERAVKQMNKKKLKDKDQLSFVYNEIQIMEELNSEYIVKIFTTHQNDEYIYIVLEYCNGGDIKKDMSRQPEKVYKLKQAALILSDVIRGLEVVHKKGILHRDIKLDNILVHIKQNKKVFKIADFGLSSQQSRGDMVLGTGSYMSPQLYNEQQYGFQVDMWAFGVVFYFMLNKQFPFKLSPFNNESLELQYSELVNQAKNFSYEQFVSHSKYKYTENCTEKVQDLFKKIFAIRAQKRITFSQIRSHPIFKQFFPEEMDQDSIVLYTKKQKVKDIHKKPTAGTKKPVKNILQENVETKKNIQIQQITSTQKYPKEKQFVLHKNSQIEFLYQNFREFKDVGGILSVVEKMPLCYNLLKYYIILKRKFIQSLISGEICRQYEEEFEDELRAFLKSSSYRKLLLELQQQLDEAIMEFETWHGDCAISLEVISEINETFEENFDDDIKSIDFDHFKKAYRKSTTYVFKKLKTLIKRGTMGNKCNYFLLLVVISHAFNRFFTEKQNLSKAFKGYLKYARCDIDSIDHNKLRVWLSKCTPQELNDISTILVTKYFEKTYGV